MTKYAKNLGGMTPGPPWIRLWPIAPEPCVQELYFVVFVYEDIIYK